MKSIKDLTNDELLTAMATCSEEEFKAYNDEMLIRFDESMKEEKHKSKLDNLSEAVPLNEDEARALRDFNEKLALTMSYGTTSPTDALKQQLEKHNKTLFGAVEALSKMVNAGVRLANVTETLNKKLNNPELTRAIEALDNVLPFSRKQVYYPPLPVLDPLVKVLDDLKKIAASNPSLKIEEQLKQLEQLEQKLLEKNQKE